MVSKRTRTGLIIAAGILVACSRGFTPLPTPDEVASLPPIESSPSSMPTTGPGSTAELPALTPMPAATLTGLHLFETEAPRSDVSFLLPLTLRHVQPDEAHFFFELDSPSAAALVLRAAGSEKEGQVLDLPAGDSRHLVQVTGLEPGKSYEVAVGVPGGDGTLERPGYEDAGWPTIAFRTPAGGALRIVIVGDSGFGGAETYQLAERMALSDPDLVLHTGDIVYRMEEEADPYLSYARKFFRPFEQLLRRAPIYTVPGNHEYDAAAQWEGRPFYDAVFPHVTSFGGAPIAEGRPQFYAFAYGDVQFIMLDSQVFYGVAGREEQELWLDERLVDPAFEQTILVFHIAPFTSSAIHPGDGRPIQSTWHPKFAAAQAFMVFNGHSHLYERLLVDGVTYVTSGGGSGSLYRVGSLALGSQALASQTHFVLLELDPGNYRLTAIALDGSVLDETAGELTQGE